MALHSFTPPRLPVCQMNHGAGDAHGRASRMISSASSMGNPRFKVRYARATAALRLTPIRQCTTSRPGARPGGGDNAARMDFNACGKTRRTSSSSSSAAKKKALCVIAHVVCSKRGKCRASARAPIAAGAETAAHRTRFCFFMLGRSTGARSQKRRVFDLSFTFSVYWQAA